MYIKEDTILWQDEDLPVWIDTFEMSQLMDDVVIENKEALSE